MVYSVYYRYREGVWWCIVYITVIERVCGGV